MSRKLSSELIKRLLHGDLNQLFNTIKEDNELAFHIRDNYVNVYYRGGNILKIKKKSKWFDEYYFFTKALPFYKDYTSKKALKENKTQKAIEHKKDLQQKRNELISSAVSAPKEFFRKAKEEMDRWFADNPKDERDEQHQQITDNSSSDDYCIIDIEYAISTKYDYFCEMQSDKGNFKVPRFDIIAINREGQVCVIELKKGLQALKGTSGLGGHLQSYNSSIARNQKSFINHICTLNEQMKELGFQNREIMNMDTVKFMFAYKLSKKIDNEREKFYIESKNQKINGIECIFIESDSYKLLDINKETLTC